MPVIEASHLTKEYQLGAMRGLKQTLLNASARLMGKTVPERPLFKALDDVSFSIEQGEVVGIIGHNGAGKSTLLKMLAKISTPTRGSVMTKGRISPLIEVGAGFVPDFTGRENVYLNGAILGMKRQEIDQKFDEIVDFSEMAEFIDTPVKRYSSGMQVKLAFAVATSVQSEILIVDEVLAVGDLAFQRKCFDRMEDVIKGQGRTILLVSHNIRQVERMCNRVILMDHGKVAADGPVSEVCELFYQQSNTKIQAQAHHAATAKVSGSGEVTIDSIDVLDDAGHPVNEIESGGRLRVRIRFTLLHDLEGIEIVAGTHRTDFIYISSASTRDVLPNAAFSRGSHEVEYIVPSFPLAAGTYSVRLVFLDKNWRFLFNGESLKTFTVKAKRLETMNSQWKTVDLPTEMRVDGTLYALPQ
ncbi:MAG: ABC transporter ATP-binding protein [Gammaproteobacteria bacterium]|nr:ABC transporter ATP-binding protein [Gammaproteobacteria bacterium]